MHCTDPVIVPPVQLSGPAINRPLPPRLPEVMVIAPTETGAATFTLNVPPLTNHDPVKPLPPL